MSKMAGYRQLLCGLMIVCLCLAAAAAGTAASGAKAEFRPPWPAVAGEYLRDWTVCGEFPFPTTRENVSPASTAFINDYLQGHGGEANIRPTAGMTHKRPNGTLTEWEDYSSLTDTLYYSLAFPEQPYEGVVWYAFTTVFRDNVGEAVFSVSSGNAIKIWLNGKLVHEHFLARDNYYEDLFAVPLQAGENAVLVKVLQRNYPGNFSFRVMETAQAEMQEATGTRLSPALLNAADTPPGQLIVLTDDQQSNFLPTKPLVQVEALAAGGKRVAGVVVPRGERAVFTTAGWAEGPYELRLRMICPSGREVVDYLPWYRGDAVQAARALVAAAPPPEDRTPEGMIHSMLANMVNDRANGDLAKMTAEQIPELYPALMEYAELRRQQAERANGFVRLAWRDPIDDSPQFCRVYLPIDYDPAKQYPLVVELHGRTDDFPPYYKWWGNDERHDWMADRYHVIVAYPHGRGNAWFRGMGDTDVMRAIALIKQRFPIDEDRVYLKGHSMGGAGVWYVGTHHPETFAALTPFYGGYDYRFQLDEKSLTALTAHERYRRERLSYIAQAESLLNIPVFASHGDSDGIVQVDYSRFTVQMLQRWGYNVRYWEQPGKGHGGLTGEEATMEWLLAQKRVVNPPHVRVRSADLRDAAAYWVKIEQRKDPYAFMQADAEVIAPNCIRLETENVLQVTLSPPAPLINAGALVKVIWNGANVRLIMPEAGKLTLSAAGYAPVAPVKRPGVEGPVTDVFNTPFALVVGTVSPDPLMRRMCARAAQRFISWWEERHHSLPRVFKDTEISADDQQRYSLILFGGPDDNLVAKKLADRLPLKITANAIIIDGHGFHAHDDAVQMLYPNPLNPDRYVVIRAGTSPAGMFYADYVLNDVDFSIVDGRNASLARMGAFFDVVSGRNTGPVLVAGYFDNAWRCREENVERGVGMPIGWSIPRSAAAVSKEQSLPLSDLVETHAEGAFLDMLRNIDTWGNPPTLARKRAATGLAITPQYWLPKTPSFVEFDLTDGNWTRLRGTVGLEMIPELEITAAESLNTRITFIVKGDGIELYRSVPFDCYTKPQSLDLDITGVNTLRLEVLNTTVGANPVLSIDWADIRVEK